MNRRWDWKTVLLGVGLLAVATLAVAGVCGLVCAVFMLPLGFQYESLWGIVAFFFWGAVAAIPLSLVAGALPNALYRLGKLPLWAVRLGYLVLDTVATALGLGLVDLVMESVYAPDPALVLAGFLLALPGLKDVGKEKPQ